MLSMIGLTQAGHYLIWLPMCSKSVKIGVMEAGYELARRGHEVTVVSPFKNQNDVEGVTDIVIESEVQELSNRMTDFILENRYSTGVPIFTFIEVSIINNRNALNSPEFREILNNKPVDVVIVVPIFGNEAGYFIAHKKNASLVLFLTAPVSKPWTNWAVGDIFNPSFIPLAVPGYSQEMTFPQRIINTLATLVFKYGIRDLYTVPQIHSMLRAIFPDEDIPHVDDLIQKTALLINHGSPFLGDGLRPVMPKTIMAGFMSCNPTNPLPADLEDWVQGADHGVILVSFGSVIQSSKMPESKRQSMLKTFAKLKQRIIWKWEIPMPDAPPNVLVSSWLPQTSLLAHKNVKAFITHGGAGGIQETICHKTPIIAIPISMDQFFNVQDVEQKNYGIVLNLHEVTEQSLMGAIDEVFSNPAYTEAVSQLSDLVMDQPQHPLQRAAWWLEYLLRHPHNPGMQSPVHKLYWFQYFLLDVIITFILILLLVFSVVRRIVKYLRSNKEKLE